MPTVAEAKVLLDSIINKGRVDLYKPIQIAEVLYRSRTVGDLDVTDLDTYRTASQAWRDEVTLRILSKRSTSSAQYQHNVWADNAMLPTTLAVLDAENKRTVGAVERYIYLRFLERQNTVLAIIEQINQAANNPSSFQLPELLSFFVTQPGLKRSIDKAYEIVTYALLETVVRGLGARVSVSVPEGNQALLHEFADLAKVLLNVSDEQPNGALDARIYRAGGTNAADRGLDMWTNFGPIIQVKHRTLNAKSVREIVDQVKSDHIVVVCRNADFIGIERAISQADWGRRVRGIITEADLVEWYERCLRGAYADRFAHTLMELLQTGFKKEFPHSPEAAKFYEERGYTRIEPPAMWQTTLDAVTEA